MVDRVTITGGTGFVGRHIAERFRRDGADVRVLSRKTGEDLLDPHSLRGTIAPQGIVVHAAYAPGIDNLAAARNIAAAALAADAKCFVHVSTAVVAGRSNEDVVDESTPPHPTTDYEREKLSVENALRDLLRERLRILRPTAVFGQGSQNLVSLVAHLKSSSRKKIALKMAVMGRRQMNLVAVENVAAAVRHLVDVDETGPFLINDDHASNDYVHVAQRLMEGLGMPVLQPPLDLSFMLALLLRAAGRPVSNPRTRYSAARLRATGYRPVVDFDDAVRAFGAASR